MSGAADHGVAASQVPLGAAVATCPLLLTMGLLLWVQLQCVKLLCAWVLVPAS
jgi:hypothetical protein